jgi:transcriptional regulator
MGKANNRRHIEERREKILLLMSRGYSQAEITKELGITRQTMSSDMRFINESTKKGLFGLAKETLSTMYYNCVQNINEVQKECWRIYRNEDNNSEIHQWHRMSALNLLRKCNESKFSMFKDVPALMEIQKLQSEIQYIKEKTFDEKGNLIRHLTDKELEDLDKP